MPTMYGTQHSSGLRLDQSSPRTPHHNKVFSTESLAVSILGGTSSNPPQLCPLRTENLHPRGYTHTFRSEAFDCGLPEGITSMQTTSGYRGKDIGEPPISLQPPVAPFTGLGVLSYQTILGTPSCLRIHNLQHEPPQRETGIGFCTIVLTPSSFGSGGVPPPG